MNASNFFKGFSIFSLGMLAGLQASEYLTVLAGRYRDRKDYEEDLTEAVAAGRNIERLYYSMPEAEQQKSAEMYTALKGNIEKMMHKPDLIGRLLSQLKEFEQELILTTTVNSKTDEKVA